MTNDRFTLSESATALTPYVRDVLARTIPHESVNAAVEAACHRNVDGTYSGWQVNQIIGDAVSLLSSYHSSMMVAGYRILVTRVCDGDLPCGSQSNTVEELASTLLDWCAAERASAAEYDETVDPRVEVVERIATNPPTLMVAAVLVSIREDITYAIQDYVSELAEGDGSDMGRSATRISVAAWSHAASVWAASST